MDIFQQGNGNKTKSLIKWAGGKGRVLKHLVPLLHSEEFKSKNKFYEPFCGSCTVSLCASNNKIILNDKNTYLINFFTQVKNKPEKLYRKIYKLIESYNQCKNKKDFYDEIKRKYNSQILVKGNGLTNAAYFWFLNQTGFNGMYRETKNGKFNIPFGKRKCPSISWEHVNDVRHKLEKADLYSEGFETFCNRIGSNNSVYFDPPYLPLSKTSSFNSYTNGNFGIDKHKNLAQIMTELAIKNNCIIMSNSDSKLTHEIYGQLKGFKIKTIEVSRSISAKASSRKKVGEVLIHNLS